MGKLIMRIGGFFIPEASETVEMFYQFENLFVVDSSKFVKAFGDIATPHRDAIRNTIAWYRQHLQAQNNLKMDVRTYEQPNLKTN